MARALAVTSRTALAVVALGCACSRAGDDGASVGPSTDGSATTGSTAIVSSTTTASTAAPDVTEPTLRAELLEMQRIDQQERTGEGLPPRTKLGAPQDFTRAERLKVIIAEHGWPTFTMVGRDGATAAWVVAQHADFRRLQAGGDGRGPCPSAHRHSAFRISTPRGSR